MAGHYFYVDPHGESHWELPPDTQTHSDTERNPDREHQQVVYHPAAQAHREPERETDAQRDGETHRSWQEDQHARRERLALLLSAKARAHSEATETQREATETQRAAPSLLSFRSASGAT